MFIYKELKRLFNSHKAQLTVLEESCRKVDSTRGFVCKSTDLNVRKDLPVFFLCYKDKQLIGYLNLFLPGNGEAELNALVHPTFRQQGIFKELLSRADAALYSTCIRRRLFVCEPQSAASSAVMKAMHARLINSEYQMVFLPYGHDNSSISHDSSRLPGNDRLLANDDESNSNHSPELGELLPAEVSDLPVLAQMEALFFGSDLESAEQWVEQSFRTPNINVYKYVFRGIPIGTGSLCIENHSCNLFGLGILPPYRGKGFGKHLLHSLIAQTPADKELYLQVSGKNTVALQLYLNHGFRVSTQQDFWLLPGKN